jgi:hypothetical protein
MARVTCLAAIAAVLCMLAVAAEGEKHAKRHAWSIMQEGIHTWGPWGRRAGQCAGVTWRVAPPAAAPAAAAGPSPRAGGAASALRAGCGSCF